MHVLDLFSEGDKKFLEGSSDDPCWNNYKQYGMKMQDGKKVPDCRGPVKKEDMAEDQIDEMFDPTSSLASFLRSAASIASDFIPVGIGAASTFAATSAMLGPVAAAIASTAAGNQIFQTLQNQQNKVPGFIQRLIEKYFGSEAEALEFAVLHAKAAFLGKSEFRWRGQQWPVLLTKDSAEAIIEKNDNAWLDNFRKEKTSGKQQGMAEGDPGARYKVKQVGRDGKGDYYISPSTGKKIYKSGVKRGDHENPNTGEVKSKVKEDDEAVQAFLAKGGQIQYGKTHKPRKAEKWQGSAHIGAAGGKGSKGSVSGMGANTNPKGSKPVVSVESSLANIAGEFEFETEIVDPNFDPTQHIDPHIPVIVTYDVDSSDLSEFSVAVQTVSDINGKDLTSLLDNKVINQLDDLAADNYRKKIELSKRQGWHESRVTEELSVNQIAWIGNLIPSFIQRAATAGKHELQDTGKFAQILGKWLSTGELSPQESEFAKHQFVDILKMIAGGALAYSATAGIPAAHASSIVGHVVNDVLKHSTAEITFEALAAILSKKLNFNFPKKLLHALTTSGGHSFEKSQGIEKPKPDEIDKHVSQQFKQARSGFSGLTEDGKTSEELFDQPKVRKFVKMLPDGKKVWRYEVLNYQGVLDRGGFDDEKSAREYLEHNRVRLSDPAELKEELNPADTVTMDVPMLLRIMEYSKEDAKTDMDLHNVVTNLVDMSQNGETLTMKNYNDAVANASANDTDPNVVEQKGRYWCKQEKRWKDV